MILSLLSKTFEKEKDRKIENEHFGLEIGVCTALSIAVEHILEDMPLAIGSYVFIAISLFSSCIHNITRFLLVVALSMAQLRASQLQGNDITIIPLKLTISKANIQFAQSFKR